MPPSADLSKMDVRDVMKGDVVLLAMSPDRIVEVNRARQKLVRLLDNTEGEFLMAAVQVREQNDGAVDILERVFHIAVKVVLMEANAIPVPERPSEQLQETLWIWEVRMRRVGLGQP